jgi:uncharacterized protein DUF2341
MKYFIILAFFLGSMPIIAGEPLENCSTSEKLAFGDFPGWNRKQAIVINQNMVKGSTNLVDFPFLVTLDHLDGEIVDGGTNSALNGGGDIRFSSDADGNNRLAIEVVEFVTSTTAADRKCQIWVKIPSLSATADTTIYIWYNKSGETQPVPIDTFGSQNVWSNYFFVSHDGLYDSATNQNLTVVGAPTTGTTTYGSTSWKGNGTTDYSYLSDSGIDMSGNISISIWKKNTSTATNFGHSISLSNSTGWISLASHVSGSNASRTYFASEPQSEASGEGMRIFPSSDYLGWHYFSISETTLIGEGELMRGDGQAATLSPTTGFGWLRPSQQGNIVLGGKNGGDYMLHCELAEIRISQSIISPDFSDTDFNTMNSPSTFAYKGAPEDGNSGGGTIGGYWTQTATDISYSVGNVGIGTTNIPSDYKLAVNGKIMSEEVKVQLQSQWPDYVFAKDYTLPTLEEVKKHIEEKGHLMNIPSAKEVETNGIQLGEMNKLLLEKIEELTLYILEQEERILELEKIEKKK